ncbi:MAG: membrane protein insertion efficiency factor YidD [Ignavibacteriaceae bacterium]|nr:membrane protein insertion efficiency factor YidD [Ignavibacteriaceae bacterium]
MAKYILFFFFLFAAFLSAQTDWQRWEKKDVSYQKISTVTGGDYSIEGEDIVQKSAKLFIQSYRILFSNLDGDNCPFTPSCSSFFYQAVKRTNPLKAVLMFTDRFTRDTNPFNRYTSYPIDVTGKLYDPVDLYLLDAESIHYHPPFQNGD